MNSGGGVVRGTIAYAPVPLPAVGAPCRPTSFSLDAESVGAGANSVISGYVGPIAVTGTGSSPCEYMTIGEGTVALNLTGRNDLGSELECAGLAGRWTRTLTDLTVQVSGSCTVNRYGAGVVLVVMRLQSLPNGVGGGVLTSVSSATAAGMFTIAPN